MDLYPNNFEYFFQNYILLTFNLNQIHRAPVEMLFEPIDSQRMDPKIFENRKKDFSQKRRTFLTHSEIPDRGSPRRRIDVRSSRSAPRKWTEIVSRSF